MEGGLVNSCTTFNKLMRNSKPLHIEHVKFLTVLRMELTHGKIFSLKENSSEVSEMDLIPGSFNLGTQIQNKHTKMNLTYVIMENCII